MNKFDKKARRTISSIKIASITPHRKLECKERR